MTCTTVSRDGSVYKCTYGWQTFDYTSTNSDERIPAISQNFLPVSYIQCYHLDLLSLVIEDFFMAVEALQSGTRSDYDRATSELELDQ